MHNVIMDVNIVIKDIIRKIDIQTDQGSSTNKIIADYLIKLYKEKKQLEKMAAVSKKLFISNAAVSKFMKIIRVESFSILRFIYHTNSRNNKNIELENDNEDIKKSINLIEDSRKILMVGEGNSHLLLNSFYVNLVKIGYNAITVEASGDQEFIASKLEKNDLLIILSFSMTKKYIKSIINNAKSKILLITSSNLNVKNVDTTIRIDSNDINVYNEFVYGKNIHVMKILDDIHRGLKSKY